MSPHYLLAIVAAVLPVLHILGVLSAIEVLLSRRNSQTSIAWCLFLVFFPVLGLPVYWTLGRSRFKGYQKRIARVVEHQQHSVQWYHQQIRDKVVKPDDPVPARAETFARIACSEFVGENDLRLLIDGRATFDAILEAIDRASRFVLVEFFIVKDDGIGSEFKAKLLAAAARGVRVFFMYDEVGSHSLPKTYLRDLREAGVEVTQFGTRKGGLRNFFQVNFRNHRKIVVVDGQVGFIGGHNVGDEYLGLDPYFGHWRDTHLRIEGPGVLHLKGIFFADWVWATGKPPELEMLVPNAAGTAVVLTIPSGPADEHARCLSYFTQCISSACSRVWISSPYFIPDEGLLNALYLAALRGVDVRVLLPAKKDHLLVWLASFFYAPEAARRGVRLFRYRDGFLHQKAVVVDSLYASIGSANFDNRSFRLNFEATSLVYGAEFNTEVAKMLERDMAQSTEVTRERGADFPLWKRVGSRFARLFSPIL